MTIRRQAAYLSPTKPEIPSSCPQNPPILVHILEVGGLAMLTISVKALGKKRALFADFSIPSPPDPDEGGAVRVSDLPSRIVRHQVEEFRERQEDRKFVMALTECQIGERAMRGKIDTGGGDLGQKVDIEGAIRVALVAFEDILFLDII